MPETDWLSLFPAIFTRWLLYCCSLFLLGNCKWVIVLLDSFINMAMNRIRRRHWGFPDSFARQNKYISLQVTSDCELRDPEKLTGHLSKTCPAPWITQRWLDTHQCLAYGQLKCVLLRNFTMKSAAGFCNRICILPADMVVTSSTDIHRLPFWGKKCYANSLPHPVFYIS